MAHSILLYSPAYDDVYFVTRFLSGLKEEIQSPITLHRPKDLDTACMLAFLQEAELESMKPKHSNKADQKDSSRVTYKAAVNSEKLKPWQKPKPQ